MGGIRPRKRDTAAAGISGRQQEVGAGEYELEWDGEDEAGGLVPPGMYVLRFHVEADEEGAGLDVGDVIRTVAVAY